MKPHSSRASSSTKSQDSGADKGSERARDKRERILNAAEQVFARSGFFQSRVSEIARDAGVADGTIYLYFKSKDDILISLFESRMERVNQRMGAALAGLRSPSEKLDALVHTHLSMVKEHPQLAEVLTIELRQSSKFMKEYANPRFGEFLKLLASVIEEGQRAGELTPTVPAPQVARMLFGIIDELALTWLLRRREGRDGLDGLDIDQATRWVNAMVMDGLKPRTDAASADPPETEATQPPRRAIDDQATPPGQ
ncbi:MAG: hypothetical protein Tsb0020_29820 [Haliangiales bacterium]